MTREEVSAAREELRDKALKYELEQTKRLTDIGDGLMSAVPNEDWDAKPVPFVGFSARQIDKDLKRLFRLREEKGVVITDIRSSSPAEKSGLQIGDVILAINDKGITKSSHVNVVVKKLKLGEIAKFRIKRGEEHLTIPVKASERKPYFPIVLDNDPTINACTDGKAIYMKKGIMQFAESDDEIAAILAHELAHAVRGHIEKGMAVQTLTMLAALAVGAIAEHNSPGSGEGVARGLGHLGNIYDKKYSRDQEREADYFSVKFMYLAGYDVEACATLEERLGTELPPQLTTDYLDSHPNTPERVARMRKAIEEVRSGKFNNQQLPEPQLVREETSDQGMETPIVFSQEAEKDRPVQHKAKQKENWERLKKGMSDDALFYVLGEPDEVRKINVVRRRLLYPDGGWVELMLIGNSSPGPEEVYDWRCPSFGEAE